MSQWTTEPIFDSPGLIVFIAIVFAAVTLLVGPVSQSLTTSRRRILIGLRIAASIVLLLALLRPAVVHTDNQPAAATLPILLDTSRSMTLPSGGEGSRWQVQREVWEQIASLIDGGDPTLNVVVYQYDSALEAIEPDAIKPLLARDPTGETTDLTGALRETLSLASGQPLAGIVLVGDGTQTSQDASSGEASATAGPQEIASTLASLEIPLWTVAIGPRVDSSMARDVAIDGLAEQFQVFSKNVFDVTASLSARGLDGRSIPVRLNLIDAEGKEEEIAVREIVAGGNDDDQSISLQLPAPAPGSYRLELVADPQDGEVLTGNNRQVAFLDVREGGGRILYLEGEPRQEQLFLRRSILQSDDFDLAFQWVEQPRDVSAWPVELGVAFGKSRYEVYVLGDLDAAALGEKQLSELRDRIGEGAGLLLLGGYQSFDAGGYGDSALEAAIPVKLSRRQKQRIGREVDASFHLAGRQSVRVAKSHPINQIFASEKQAEGWASLKPLLGANRFAGPKPLPGVQVLLENERRDPLLIVGDYGKGRVVAFAGDSTYQWWRQGQRNAHRRFWRQVLLWLLRREDTPPNQVAIEIDQRRFGSETPVAFQASVRDADGQTIGAVLQASVIDVDEKVTPIEVARSDNGADGEAIWSGQIQDLADGLYRLRVAAAGDEESGIVAGEIAFQVRSIDRELSRPIADIAQMEQLALLTSEVGGESIDPRDAAKLRELIDQHRSRSLMPVVSKWRMGDEPTSGWIVLILFAGILTTDWALRKSWGLV